MDMSKVQPGDRFWAMMDWGSPPLVPLEVMFIRDPDDEDRGDIVNAECLVFEGRYIAKIYSSGLFATKRDAIKHEVESSKRDLVRVKEIYDKYNSMLSDGEGKMDD